jgi:hypothetical protein
MKIKALVGALAAGLTCAWFLIGEFVKDSKTPIVFRDRLPENLSDRVEKIAFLTCVLDDKPKTQKELIHRCHKAFLQEAKASGGTIIVVDPREIRSVSGRACFLQDGIVPMECPENIYMYGTLYRVK